MTVSSLGDLATSTFFRGQHARLRSEMETLIQDLARNQVSVRDTALGGSFRAVSGLERSLTRLDAYDLAATEAEGFMDVAQSALGAIQETSEELSVDLLAAEASGTPAHLHALASGARQDFESVIARLNIDYAGRSVFGGHATDSAPVADAATILDALEAEIAASGATTATDVATVIETWFAPGGGYDSIGYLGSAARLAPLSVGQGQTVAFDLTAQNQEVRDTLAGTAMAALMESAAINSAPDEQIALARIAGDRLLNANQDQLRLRAEVGAGQETIEEAQTASQSERTALDLAMADLLKIETYERATQLEQVESQIELLYAITVRTSNLRLSNYL
ncbi:hypothetical protein [Tropicimonas sp. IMCC6043]|uniref:hypothetical protein n=1 Tax=Tropicimonas sp. IMCC6043 TaxID=2510645 RepID=UPI00101CC26A|nr:hypothetical protein [Tropicimonas sp. IMCC6043]RYH09999.1 hypothetical protein EU800_10650 [Tropicimonas sp. IMCC6043]